MRAPRIIALLLTAAVCAACIVGAAPIAHADFILTLSDGTTTVSITDAGAGDLQADVGAILVSGAIGSFSFNVTTGLSKPVLGGGFQAEMDLNSLSVFSGSTGTLTIELTDTNFLLPTGHAVLMSAIGGVLTAPAGSSLVAQQCIDFGNAEFACPAGADVIADNGPFGPGAFSSTTNVGFTSNGTPFSMTERVVIDFTGKGNVSFNYSSIARVPEPSALILIGAGLAGLGALPLWGAWRRRRSTRDRIEG